MTDKDILRNKSKNCVHGTAQFSLLVENPIYQEASTLLAYSALSYEVPSHDLLLKILDDGKKLYLPKVYDDYLLFHQIEDINNDLEMGRYHILEPRKGLKVWEYDTLDTILLVAPALACTLDGYRLGHGFGYYDRFLALYHQNNNFKSVILIDDDFDYVNFQKNDHDIPFDYVLNEHALRKC